MQQAEKTSADGDDIQNVLARWVVAGLLAGAALIGIVILLFVVSFALQPPEWVQVVLGVALAMGAAVFTWLLASAFGSKRS